MSDSSRNLKEAFAGECQAFAKYRAFARRAQEEGLREVARLFRAVARSEALHAANLLAALQEVGNTRANLEAALEGESAEVSGLYPMFVDQARKEDHQAAAQGFSWALEAEKVHMDLFERALKALGEGREPALGTLMVCRRCGHTLEGEPPAQCPTCGTKHSFQEIS